MTAIRRWQIALVAVGVLLLLLGGLTLINDVSPRRYLGLAAWLLGALVIHDGVISLTVFGANVAMRKTGRRVRLPLPALLILQGALVVAGIMTLIVVPAALKKSIGTGNDTLLPLDYGLHLVVFYAALAVVTALALAVYAAVGRRGRPARSA